MLHCRLRMLLRATLLACSVLSAFGSRLCRLSPAAFYFIVCCCRNSWSVKGLCLPPPPLPASPLPSHHTFPSLFLHFTFLWAIEQQQQQQQKRQLLLVSVSLSTSTLASPLINMQRYCKRTKRAKPKTNEQKKENCRKNKQKTESDKRCDVEISP